MSQNVNWNGTTYAIPDAGNVNWPSLTNFLLALGNNAAVAIQAKQAIRLATATPVTVSATTDYCVVTDLSVAGAVAVNLPAGVNGQIFVIVDGKGDAGSNNITITPNGAQTIKGAATLVLNHNSQAVMLQYSSTGTDWKVLANVLYPGTITPADITGVVPASKGGTGISNNDAATLTRSGNHALTFTTTNTTGVTLPTTGTLATLAGTEQLTNKDYEGGTASNSLRMTLPKNTTTNLNALTRKEGTLVYDTDLDVVKYDNGSSLSALASTATATPSAQGIVTSYAPVIRSAVVAPGDADVTITETDGYEVILYATTLTGDRTITLPAVGVSAGRRLAIKRTAGGAFKLILSTGAIDGTTSTTLNALYSASGTAVLRCNGSVWFYEEQPYDEGTWSGTFSSPTNLTITTPTYSGQRWNRQGNRVNVMMEFAFAATFTLGTAGNTTHVQMSTTGLPNYLNGTAPAGMCALISSAPRSAPGSISDASGGNTNIILVFTTLNMANGDTGLTLVGFNFSYILT